MAKAADGAIRHAFLLQIAYWVSGPFPDATELIVSVDDTSGELALTAIRDATGGYLWTNDGGVCDCPSDYRTADDACLDQVIDEINLELDSVIEGVDPRIVWDKVDDILYRVQLPTSADIDRLERGEPLTADVVLAVIARDLEALARLRVVLDQRRPALDTGRADRREGAAVLLRDMSAALDELERATVDQLRLRLEVVVDRNPDSGTEVAAFINGTRFTADVTVVDPGAQQQTLRAWREICGSAVYSASPAAADQIRAFFDSYVGSKFVS
ncbi:MAG TPA: hypothetical protein VFG15_03110 [Amycolatopsis sp.]|nr:hypothetical protein [Amycolatopsis sp.]